jgi:hypothetical protein
MSDKNWIKSFGEAVGNSSKSWYFTFIAWWCVFNWDFILLFLGNFDRLQEINQYYCGLAKLTLFSCEYPIESAKWEFFYKFYHYPLISKLLLPILLTVFSLLGFERGIQWVLLKNEECTTKTLKKRKALKQELDQYDYIKELKAEHKAQSQATSEKQSAEIQKLAKEKNEIRFQMHRARYISKDGDYRYHFFLLHTTLQYDNNKFNTVLSNENVAKYHSTIWLDVDIARFQSSWDFADFIKLLNERYDFIREQIQEIQSDPVMSGNDFFELAKKHEDNYDGRIIVAALKFMQFQSQSKT